MILHNLFDQTQPKYEHSTKVYIKAYMGTFFVKVLNSNLQSFIGPLNGL